jgi:hypothetical protein
VPCSAFCVSDALVCAPGGNLDKAGLAIAGKA